MTVSAPFDAARSRALIALLAGLTAMDAIAIDMFLPALPTLQGDLQTTSGAVQQTLSVFLFGLALGQLLCGPLLDRFGRRLPLLAGVALYIAGSLVAALSPDIGTLLGARFIQALGASVAVAAPRAIVADLFDDTEAARVYTLLMQVFMIGPVLAPLAGSALLVHGSWRDVFWALAACGGILGAWSLRSLPETLPTSRRMPLALGPVLRAYAALLRHPTFVLYSLTGGISMGSLLVYLSQAPFVLQQHFGVSQGLFGVLLAANALGIVAAGAANHVLLRHWSPLSIVLGALRAHTAVGVVLWGWVAAGEPGLWGYAFGLSLAMATIGLTFGNLSALTMAHAGEQAGTASALMGLLQMALGAAVGALAAGLAPTPGPLPIVFVACGAISLACCVLAARPPRVA